MKLAFVSPTFPPDNGWGGIGTYVWQTLFALAGHGIHTTVITGLPPAGRTESSIVSQNLTILRILDLAQPNTVRKTVTTALSEMISRGALDAVEFPDYEALGLDFQKLHPQFPTIVRLHGDTSLCYFADLSRAGQIVKSVLPNRKVNRQRDLEAESIRLSTLVSAPSHWALAQAANRGWLAYGQKIEVIPNPFFGFPPFDTNSKVSNGDETDVIVLGRLDRRKGADLLPSVVNRIHAVNPKVKFRFVGQSGFRTSCIKLGNKQTYADWIKSRIAPRSREIIDIRDGVSYPEVQHQLRGGKVALFLSNMETFGYTHVEAMYAGLAVVIGSIGGARELGRDNEHVLLIRRSAKDAALCILGLLASPENIERLGKSARRHVIEVFGSEELKARLRNIYKQVIAAGS